MKIIPDLENYSSLLFVIKDSLIRNFFSAASNEQ